jgi:hypothetical protein
MSATVRLTQLDGKLPNLALMRLAAFHKAQGDDIRFSRSPYRQLDEPAYKAVYGSAIFEFSADRLERFKMEFPEALVGGTGSGSNLQVEDIVGNFHGLDYSPWPNFTGSLGFTQRGCRLSCKFCVVPKKEGKPRAVATIADIWRGEGHPKHLHLLDNDFFGQPEDQWRARIAEISEGGFKVCFNQGVNVRAITDETSAALASVDYRDDSFKDRRLYTAWDNLKDERVFLDGVDRLERAGVSPKHLMAYMLLGFDKNETWERVFHRFEAMVARGIRPYPMVYGDRTRSLPGKYSRLRLMDFQRWVNTGLYRRGVDFATYDNSARHDPTFKTQADLFSQAAA